MNRLTLWLDNPILVKHARSRLRAMQLFPAVAVVMILALCVVLIGYQFDRLRGGGTFGGLMALQSIILGIMGAAQVGTSVGKARDSGILDFHRVAPMRPLAVTLGFFFGAPIREYLLFAATLPFSLICVAAGRPSPQGFFQLMVPLLLAAWVLHAVALLNALSWQGRRNATRGVIGLVLFIFFGSGSMFSGFSVAATAVDETPTLGFYWWRLPWLLVLAFDLLPAIGFLLTASARKMASDRAHALSKPQAVACLATGEFLLVGGLWDIEWFGYWALVVLYATMILAISLSVTITPNLGEYTKGVRQAIKEGRSHPSAWSDRGLNRPAVVGLCLLTLIGPTVAWRAIEEPATWASQRGPVSYSLSIAIGVIVVAYVGLAMQYFQIRFGKRGPIFMALFLFAAWLLPFLVGTIAMSRPGTGSGPGVVGPVLMSLCPLVGIALSSGAATEIPQLAAQAAALLPALGFAFLFNNLVVKARRRIDGEINPAIPGPTPDPLFDAEPGPATQPLAVADVLEMS